MRVIATVDHYSPTTHGYDTNDPIEALRRLVAYYEGKKRTRVPIPGKRLIVEFVRSE